MKLIKKENIKYLILIFISIIFIIFAFNNHFLYKNSILKITNINENISDDEIIVQDVTGIIKNGKYKDKVFNFENESSVSGVYDERLHKNSEVMVEISDGGTNINQIIGVKRDKYIVILVVLFLDLMIIIGGNKGIKSLISLIINITISLIAIFMYLNENIKINIFPLFIILSIIFIILSLSICHGFNKKTLVAMLSSISSLLISFIISYVVLESYTDSIYYWNMDYIEIISDYKGIFYLNILLSSLGAIMDIAITMASSLEELIIKNNNISFKELRKSGKEISKDILGTMINVMLFTCYVAVIPIVILAIRNNMPLAIAIENYGQIEMIRILTSSISIVLAIPISLYITLLIYKGGKHD